MNMPISPIGPVGQTYPVTRIQPTNKDREPEQKKQHKKKHKKPTDKKRDDGDVKTTIDETV